MNEKTNKPGLFQRITGYFSHLLGTSVPDPAQAPERARRLSRSSGAGPAVKIPRPPSESATPNPNASDSHLSDVTFAQLDLPDEVRQGLAQAGFVRATPVQAKTLPIALAGGDVAAQAQTGTGKTAAFLVTTFTRLLRSTKRPTPSSPRAFVIAPTRELVAQIEADAKVLGAHAGFKIQAVYGGVDYDKQREILRGGIDVLIGTPGRLIDYYKQKVYNLRGVEVLIIDEADRMFDMGFLPDLRYLLRKLPPYNERQSMLFSATLPYRVMELAYEHMNLPTKVEIAPEQKTADGVTEMLYHVGGHEKMRLLLGLLDRDRGNKILIFVNTKVEAERLVRRLTANGHPSAELSGDVPQKRRMQVLDDFKSGQVAVLVATDVAARGLHIDSVTHVYNYDIPLNAEDYVHRIGRTARAGQKGHAISLACERFVSGLEPIEAYIGHKLPTEWADDTLYRDEKRAPPRPDDRRPMGRDGERRGAPRAEHGRREHAGHRGSRGSSRPDPVERTVGHHVTKEATLEAQLEAEGVDFEDVGSGAAMAAPSVAPTPGNGAPSGRRRRRRRGRGGRGAEGQPAAGQQMTLAEDGVELEGGDTGAMDADEITEGAPAATDVAAGADGATKRRRRRRRGGRGRRNAAVGEATPVEEVAVSADGKDIGGFWDPV